MRGGIKVDSHVCIIVLHEYDPRCKVYGIQVRYGIFYERLYEALSKEHSGGLYFTLPLTTVGYMSICHDEIY